MALSGAAGLTYEVVWMRGLHGLLGGGAPAQAFTVGVFLGGLALGGGLVRRVPTRPAARYAMLELLAAAWCSAGPWLLDLAQLVVHPAPWARWPVAAALLLPASVALGATWPALATASSDREAATLYAANTAGAVVGVIASTFLFLPTLGIRGTTGMAVALGLGAAALASQHDPRMPAAPPPPSPDRAELRWLVAAALVGASAMGLEVLWMRLAAVAMGATVQMVGVVLATFLATLSIGAAVGRRWPAEPVRALPLAFAGMSALALLGAASWGALPFGVARLYAAGGPEWLFPGSIALAAVLMGGAPVASGLAFTWLVRTLGAARSGPLYAANGLGCVLGALGGGLWLLPTFGPRTTVLVLAALPALAGLLTWRKSGALGMVAVALGALLLPGWDARLYAVGIYSRISDFADPSPRSIRAFAEEGWELLSYTHGQTAAVAVGRSRATGNLWLSVNGKVDASTGDDMPTQLLSGHLPTAISPNPEHVLVVGLASGVTAGAVLEDGRVRTLEVAEIEPAVVDASHAFDAMNGRPLDDPRTTLRVDDARALLQHGETLYDVIISEPSNPWITGTSSLFTLEYWQAARNRLAQGGVMCQWVQLYGLGTEEFRAVVRTFLEVFPNTWLFVTIEGSDVLLIATDVLPPGLPIHPRVEPAGLRSLAGPGWLNTDDHPRVEWAAPRYLHYDTASGNAALIESWAVSRISQ
jgi:spermidine synthase